MSLIQALALTLFNYKKKVRNMLYVMHILLSPVNLIKENKDYKMEDGCFVMSF